jgi:hypothetical protein
MRSATASMRSTFAFAALFCVFAGGHADAQVGPNGEVERPTRKVHRR